MRRRAQEIWPNTSENGEEIAPEVRLNGAVPRSASICNAVLSASAEQNHWQGTGSTGLSDYLSPEQEGARAVQGASNEHPI